MAFWLGKILTAIFLPSHVLVYLLVILLLLASTSQLKAFFSGLLSVLLLVLMFLPIGEWALLPLEQCPSRSQLPTQVDGAIVLGGVMDEEVSAAAGEAQFNSGVDRVLAMLKLMRAYPQATFVFSGGSGEPEVPDFHEADFIKRMLDEMGIDTSRLVLENQARNTAQNVLYTQPIFSRTPGQNWLIVTSAYHLPRALGLFRETGRASHTTFYPYPTDFRTPGRFLVELRFDLPRNLGNLDAAAKEYAGLTMNYLTGHSTHFMACGAEEEEKLK